MNLLEIEGLVFNLDNIVCFEDKPAEERVNDFGRPFTTTPRIRIHTTDDSAYSIEGEDADALRWWLKENSTDVRFAYGAHLAAQALKEKIEAHGFGAGAEAFAPYEPIDGQAAWYTNWRVVYDLIGRDHAEPPGELSGWWKEGYANGWQSAQWVWNKER